MGHRDEPRRLQAEGQGPLRRRDEAAAVETYRKGSGQRYFAYWRHGKGAQWWHAGEELAGADTAYFNLGFRIRARSHGSGDAVFVWTKGSGAQLWTHRKVSSFKAFARKQLDKGLRLTYLNLGFSL